MTGYLIAFAGKPSPKFLEMLLQMSKNDGVEIMGAYLCPGPGCSNLAILLNDENKSFVETLTMALMPAKYELCNDSKLMLHHFVDEFHG